MSSKGFSLIELMITIALIGILAAIAYPSYQDSILKSRRADAHGAIFAVQQAQERLRGDCKFYAQSIAASNACNASAALSTVWVNGLISDGGGNWTSPDGYYNVALSAASGNAYTITATAVGKQANDSTCPTITLAVSTSNSKGARGPSEDCW